MDNIYLLSEEDREVLLHVLCDNCHHCYEGLSAEEFESCCRNCKPVQTLCDLLFTNNEMVRMIYIALKEGDESMSELIKREKGGDSDDE